MPYEWATGRAESERYHNSKSFNIPMVKSDLIKLFFLCKTVITTLQAIHLIFFSSAIRLASEWLSVQNYSISEANHVLANNLEHETVEVCLCGRRDLFPLFSHSSNPQRRSLGNLHLTFMLTIIFLIFFFSDTFRPQPIPYDRKKHFWRHRPGWSISFLPGFWRFSPAGELRKLFSSFP